MTGKPTEKAIRAFDGLVPKAAELHTYTWCIESRWPIFTRSLKGRKCLRCRHLVDNGGICDPL